MIRVPQVRNRAGRSPDSIEEPAFEGFRLDLGCARHGLFLGWDAFFSVADELAVWRGQPLVYPPPGFPSGNVLTDAHGFLLGQTGVAGANSRKEDPGHDAALSRASSSSVRLKRRRLPKRWTGTWPRRTAWYK